ncbi:hypothetical protein [Streptomyces hoynatensis]|uniref:hypothetical protein n=1 Tax=Streptomyces hoynatensis TaxID=1141874 RepID=UPI0011C3E4D6|nr:hypothetical protein [Streptomyces hoynatensis]
MTRSRRVFGALLCGVAALACAVLGAQPAQAWTWSPRTTVYNGATLCVQGEAGIDHVIPGVFSGNLAYADAYALAGGCGSGLTLPDGYAAVRLEVQKWDGSGWFVCRSTDWTYGPTGVSGGDVGGPYGPSQILDYGGASSCGAGYYGTMAYAYVLENGSWHGGGVWSGYELVQ